MCMCVCVFLCLCRDDAYRATPSPCTLLLLFAACACIRVIFFSSLVLFYLSPPLPLRCVACKLRRRCQPLRNLRQRCHSAMRRSRRRRCWLACVCVWMLRVCCMCVCVSMHVCWCVCVVFIVCFLLLLLPSLLAFVVCCRSHSHTHAMLLPMLRRSAASLAVAVSTQFVRKKFSTACVGYGKWKLYEFSVYLLLCVLLLFVCVPTPCVCLLPLSVYAAVLPLFFPVKSGFISG